MNTSEPQLPGRKSFRRNFTHMFLGKLVFAISQWLLLVIVARLTSPSDLGEFTFAIALVSPIVLATQMNMRAFMATDQKNEYTLSDYFATRILGASVSILLVYAIASIGDRSLTLIMLVITIAAYKATESISDVFYGLLQKNENMAPIALAASARGISAVFCMYGALSLTGSVTTGTAAILAAWLLITLFHDFPVSRKFMTSPLLTPSPRIFEVIRSCYPLGLTLGLMSLRISIPVYFIEAMHGTEAVGYYSAVAYFLVAGNLISGALLQAAAPRLARSYHDHNSAGFSRFLYKLAATGGVIGIAGVAIAVVFGHWILGTMYGPAYAAHSDVLVWIMIAAAVGYVSQFTGLSLTVSRLFRYHLVSQSLGVASVTVLAWMLVPSQGIMGGAMALTAATVVTFISNLFVTRFRVLPSIQAS